MKGVDDAAERFDLGHDSHVSIVPDPLVFRAMDPECMELVLFADLNHYACCAAHHLFFVVFLIEAYYNSMVCQKRSINC